MKFSIIIPVYNSQNTLKKLIDEVIFEISKISNKYEIILIDDCSKDNSWKVISQVKKKERKIKAIKNKKNIGQHPSIFKGIKKSKGENIFIMDGDSQDDPKNFIKFIKQKDNKTCLFGLVPSDNHKGYFSFLFWKIFSYFTKINKNYRSTTFCLIPRNSAMKLLKLKNIGFIYAELYKLNEKIKFVAYKKNKKIDSRKGYSYLKLIFLGLKILYIYTFAK